MIGRCLMAVAMTMAVLMHANDASAHAGSADPIPKGCRPVYEKVDVNGVMIILRRIACPKDDTPTS